MQRTSQATRATFRFGLGLLVVMALLVAKVSSDAVLAASAESPAGATRLIVRFDRSPAILGGAAEALASQQLAFQASLADALPDAIVERQYAVAFSGAAVRVSGDVAQATATLAALPHVAEVYAEIAYEPALQVSAPAIGADALWPTLGGREDAGSGVVIAVLDSGIDSSHPALNPTGWSYPIGFPKGDTRYTTAKVIASRLYVRPNDPPMAGETTPSPGAEGSYHGTTMAAAAAGNVVTATLWGRDIEVSGMAPGAWLSNYRVFYPNAEGEELAYSSEVLQAIEDAVTDGADVLLLAWSSPHYVHPLRSP
ncbi:MAG: S8 family serine peptidase, partial [Anaerolineae bacterium]